MIMEHEEDRNNSLAMTQISSCNQSIISLEMSIRWMTEDVIVATKIGIKEDILAAWQSGLGLVDLYMRIARGSAEDLERFTNRAEYSALDPTKKGDYFYVTETVKKDLEKLDIEFQFFRLVCAIEYSEQTIVMLWGIIKRAKHEISYRQGTGTLASRGLAVHKKTLAQTRDILYYRIKNIMDIITTLTKNNYFSEIPDEKQSEFFSKWEYHESRIKEINKD